MCCKGGDLLRICLEVCWHAMQSPSAFGSLDVNAPSLSPAETPGPPMEAPPPPSSSAGSRRQDSKTQEPAPDSPTFSQRDRSERASSPGALAGWHVFKPAPQGRDFKTAGSLPILQSAMHRRSAFAQGAGVLPPSLGVTPSFEGPFPPQALILKDSSHRREAYAKGQGALPPAFSSRPTPPRATSSDSDTLPEASSSAFLSLGEDLLSELNEPAAPKDQLGRLVPSGRVMKQVESFNTDVVRQSIDKANRTDTNDKHIPSAGEPSFTSHLHQDVQEESPLSCDNSDLSALSSTLTTHISFCPASSDYCMHASAPQQDLLFLESHLQVPDRTPIHHNPHPACVSGSHLELH